LVGLLAPLSDRPNARSTTVVSRRGIGVACART
jgi:hypothetical protein